MEHLLKKFLSKVRPRETRELVQGHVKRLELAGPAETVVLHVDKRYAFHEINSRGHIERVIECVKRTFGTKVATVIQLDKNSSNREREKAVPHAIHYR